jgi:hypothetical protein
MGTLAFFLLQTVYFSIRSYLMKKHSIMCNLIHLHDCVFLRMLYGHYYTVLCWKLLFQFQEIVFETHKKIVWCIVLSYIFSIALLLTDTVRPRDTILG